jgi:hypothetical protein
MGGAFHPLGGEIKDASGPPANRRLSGSLATFIGCAANGSNAPHADH